MASRLDEEAAAAQQRYEQAKNELEQAKANPNLGLAGRQFPDAASLQRAQSLLDEAESAVNAATARRHVLRPDTHPDGTAHMDQPVDRETEDTAQLAR